MFQFGRFFGDERFQSGGRWALSNKIFRLLFLFDHVLKEEVWSNDLHIYKEIQKEWVEKSYMTNGLLIYG